MVDAIKTTVNRLELTRGRASKDARVMLVRQPLRLLPGRRCGGTCRLNKGTDAACPDTA